MKTMKYDINKENSLDDHDNDDGGGNQVANACLQCFKVCFKKKANFVWRICFGYRF
ncbi:unnamed protein product [Medioppia subpectinata]|uniref:Uncharacterized protein n=1 Tax=Medioppia subpectinata TaxID=1979941 RepID=A0A7R9QHK0_9ACAR|nr:unnamed protein product [Medioppia subpectinata]CAG2120119.1 unnamed protein product [Medioppia subpectinata]